MTRAQFDNIVRALGIDDVALHGVVTQVLAVFGVLADWDAVPSRDVTAADLAVGDVIAVWGHQRIRAAVVHKVGRTRVSAVYVTPSEVEAAGKFGRAIHPNNITEAIERVALIGRVDLSTVEVTGLPAEPAPVVEDEVQPAGGSAGARAAGVPAPALPEDGGLFGLLEVPVVGALF